MKFSIVLAVYNGGKQVGLALESVISQKYPTADFQLVIVNDGSSDNTSDVVDAFIIDNPGFDILFVDLDENVGRVKARQMGAENAKYDRIIIMDHQGVMDPDVLDNFSKYPAETNIIPNWYMDKNRSIYDRLIYLLSKKFYRPYWGVDFDNVEINSSNFHKVPKGTGGFVTNKNLFIKYSKEFAERKSSVGDTENEDVKLLSRYVEDGRRLLRVSEARILYKNRTGRAFFEHLYRRGPRFVSYYFKTGNLLNFMFRNKVIGLVSILILISIPIILVAILTNIIYLGYILFFIAIWILFISVYLAEDAGDVIAVSVMLPAIVLVFSLGVLNGIKIHYL